MTTKAPELKRLIVINQTIVSHAEEWTREFAEGEHARIVELWSGNAIPDPDSMIILRKLPSYDRSTSLMRLRTWFMFTVVVFARLFFVNVKDTHVLVFTNPPFLPIALWLLNRLKGIRYSVYEYDIYPQIAAVMGWVSEKHVVYRLWWHLHRRALIHADTVITLSQGMAQQLEVMVPEICGQIILVPNWVDTEWMRPLGKENNPFAETHGLKDKVVVAYSGNMGATHSIETLLNVAVMLRDMQNVVFLFIGEGTKQSVVESFLEEHRLTNARLLPFINYNQLPYQLSSIDINVITVSAGYEHLVMPSKTMNALAAGNALLGISQTPNELDLLIREGKCGANFLPNQAQPAADWIASLAQNRIQLDAYQQAAREIATIKYSKSICTQQLTSKIVNTYKHPRR